MTAQSAGKLDRGVDEAQESAVPVSDLAGERDYPFAVVSGFAPAPRSSRSALRRWSGAGSPF